MTATYHTIGIHQVALTILGAQRRGLDVDRILNRVGIPPALLDAPHSRVSLHQYASLARLLARVMRDELWGLTSGRLPLGSFAQGCRLLINAESLGEALRIGGSYYHRFMAELVLRIRVIDGIAYLSVKSTAPYDTPSFYAQRSFLFLAYGMACWLVARRIPLQYVEYPGKEFDTKSDASKMFQAPIKYGKSTCAMAFEARWMDLPIVQNEKSLNEFLDKAPINLLVRYRDQTSVTERIRRILRRYLAGKLPTLQEISHMLSITPQTLRRRLLEEGEGYQALKDSLRRDVAVEYLSQQEYSLIQISEMLGFSEPSTFHRAFKKWMGVSPGVYRNIRLNPAELDSSQ